MTNDTETTTTTTSTDTDHPRLTTDRELPQHPMTVIKVGGEEFPIWRDMPYEQYLAVRQALNEQENKLRRFMLDDRVTLPGDHCDRCAVGDGDAE